MFDEEPDDPHGECREEIRRAKVRYHADVDGAILAKLQAEAKADAWFAVHEASEALGYSIEEDPDVEMVAETERLAGLLDAAIEHAHAIDPLRRCPVCKGSGGSGASGGWSRRKHRGVSESVVAREALEAQLEAKPCKRCAGSGKEPS